MKAIPLIALQYVKEGFKVRWQMTICPPTGFYLGRGRQRKEMVKEGSFQNERLGFSIKPNLLSIFWRFS